MCRGAGSGGIVGVSELTQRRRRGTGRQSCSASYCALRHVLSACGLRDARRATGKGQEGPLWRWRRSGTPQWQRQVAGR